MSHQEFDSYLRLLCRFLHLNGNQRQVIARELRAHMEERLDELLSRGYTRDEAIQTALDEFGDAALLAGEFGRIGRRRRWIVRTTSATIGIAAAVLFVSFLLPERRPLVPAPAYTQADPPAIEPTREMGVAIASPETQTPAAHHRDRFRSGLSKESETDRTARQKLDSTLPVVEFPEGTGLAELVEFIKQQAKVSIDVNWVALAQVNVERTTDSGGLSLQNVKVETVLARLLDRINAASAGARVAYDISDGVITISTADDLNARTIVRVHDIRDLVRATEQLTPAQKEIMEILVRNLHDSTPSLSPAPEANHPAPGSSRAVEPDAKLASVVAKVLSEMRESNGAGLMKVITTTIEPDSWAPEGKVGSIDVWNEQLIVRHTAAVQRQIVDLLEQMRQNHVNPQAADVVATQPAHTVNAR